MFEAPGSGSQGISVKRLELVISPKLNAYGAQDIHYETNELMFFCHSLSLVGCDVGCPL